MNALLGFVKASFAPVVAVGESAGPGSEAQAPAERLKVVSRQLLSFRLTITYDNAAGDVLKEQAARAFLSMVGVHSLEAAWAHLFDAVQVVPFLMYTSGAVAPLNSDAASSPVRASASPSAFEGWTSTGSSTFVAGTPRFWAAHRHAWSSGGAGARGDGATPLQGSTTAELCSPATLPPALALATHSLPAVATTAPPSFVNGGNGRGLRSRRVSAADGDASRDGGGAGVHCEVIGGVLTVCADAGSPRRVPAERSDALPRLLESRYTMELALPDFEAASLRDVNAALAMVVLLPLCAAGAPAADGVDGGAAAAACGDQPSILRAVLARSVGQTQVEAAAATALVFGSGVVPVQFTEPFLCVSSTSPLSNDRLVLNLSLTNVTASTARLYSTSFDLHSSCVLPDGAGAAAVAPREEGEEQHITASPLWGEMRPGANFSSMRTIDLLTKLVTITPVVVGEERPPVVLHPGETYSFEFVLEVLPQLCYLLNPQSLEYLYARYYAVPHGEASRRPGGHGGGGGAAAFGQGSVVTDCYGVTVPAAELRGILSCSYVSHLFVYYDLAGGASVAPPPCVSDSAHRTGLYLRYPARWSFGA
ncbi:hypothetical protein NESM_000518500 [Novymonas esmeraldas]|uniref:Uncharacterized protein n=1 Tax=Novymonas esmeraldas TaxID=1808958 RepID=A0AAW0EQ91_9TRYP